MSRDAAGELGTCEDDAPEPLMQWAPDQHRYIRLAHVSVVVFLVFATFMAGWIGALVWQKVFG